MAVQDNKPGKPVESSPASPREQYSPKGEDAKVHSGPAPQGDNDADRHDAKGVTPSPLEPVETAVATAPGGGPDSLLRAADVALFRAKIGDERRKGRLDGRRRFGKGTGEVTIDEVRDRLH